ncbi:terminase small subunit [Aneurinibacillus migulanus]|uniref:Terminase n=1 Tax=Aneurinibacillus migulanus TaxID=47500 RepID=A0A0D1XZM8_ANEMI|nr:terminase small subunit [Aneurinibacillus migulanus]KIV57508.1 terminase [Aneurinibacillus migulanus]KON94877.1 terminase [Aneurinibacillus migulanus]MED0892857.1 terminase small subunit [Aneurinibacillus migulanus]MED1619103.1 terminase small subunit [Aneurinibacillus migulanus]SDI92464.1 phage terminase small subunit [Aneurinibacillus migulanus]
MSKLTPKQQAFADYYIETGNAEEAARKAGYKSPRGNAHKLLQNTAIKQYIDEIMDSKNNERIASQDEVLEYLTSVMRGVPFITEYEDTDEEGNVVTKQNKIYPYFKERNQAAELLGKRYAMWTEKQQVEGNVGVTIVDDIGDDDE